MVVLIIFYFLIAGTVSASEIEHLESDRTRLEAAADSLEDQRIGLQRQVDRLAARIDSLKAGAAPLEASGALEATLRQAMGITVDLEGVYQAQEGVREDLEGLKGRLRAAYDGEIRRLIEQLSSAPTETIGRLQALQRARDGLVQRPPASPVAVLAIGDDDGPDELRQKADLMADMATRVRQDVQTVDGAIHRLQEERRLRGRMVELSREMALFDEHLPEGRAMRLQEARQVDAPAGLVPPAASVDVPAGLVPPAASIDVEDAGFRGPEKVEEIVSSVPAIEVIAGREILTTGQSGLPGSEVLDPIEREIQTLKNRRETLVEQQERLQAQAIAFREKLKEMLGEGR